jgi:hypothetical protein
MKKPRFTFTLIPLLGIILYLLSFTRAHGQLADGHGLLRVVVRVQDQDGFGMSGIFVRQIFPDSALRYFAGTEDQLQKYRSQFTGSETAGNGSGIAVIPVFCRFSMKDGKFQSALAQDNRFVLVHPNQGPSLLNVGEDAVQWRWSEALSRPIGLLKVVYDDENKKWKVVP